MHVRKRPPASAPLAGLYSLGEKAQLRPNPNPPSTGVGRLSQYALQWSKLTWEEQGEYEREAETLRADQ